MIRVASLYLPQLPIERLRRLERPAKPPEALPAPSKPIPRAPVDDDPGACSVPRGGGWRPGARWALASHGGATWPRIGALPDKPSQGESGALPAHKRPTMREMGRRSEAADNPFKAMPPDEGARGVIERHRAWLEVVRVDDPGIFFDIDTPGDLTAI